VKSDPQQTRVVIRISPMAHLAVGFLALGLLALVLAGPAWVALLLIIPIGLSAFIVRNRTVADRDTVIARSMLGSETVRWDDVDGLRFGKGSSAYAHLKDGKDLRLPAVTFATLPLLTEASGGRVPNPYSRD
jgi:Bacterial PH domain